MVDLELLRRVPEGQEQRVSSRAPRSGRRSVRQFLAEHALPASDDMAIAFVQCGLLLDGGCERVHVVDALQQFWLVRDQELADLQALASEPLRIAQTVVRPQFGYHVSPDEYAPGDVIHPASVRDPDGTAELIRQAEAATGELRAILTWHVIHLQHSFIWDLASPTAAVHARAYSANVLVDNADCQRANVYLVRLHEPAFRDVSDDMPVDAWMSPGPLTVLAKLWTGPDRALVDMPALAEAARGSEKALADMPVLSELVRSVL
jgi:hypothetical protein